ncbi:hypothetical protein SDJN03_29137, partial [Cucurbita argyrosperma subsp. sororia]
MAATHHRFNPKFAPLTAVIFMVMLVTAAAGRHALPLRTEEAAAIEGGGGSSSSSSSSMIMRRLGYTKSQMEHLRRLSSSTARYIPGGPDSQHHSRSPRSP